MWVEQISFSYARMYLGEVLCFLIDTLGEEKILYQDADGVDYGAFHVFNMNAEGCVSSISACSQKLGGVVWHRLAVYGLACMEQEKAGIPNVQMRLRLVYSA